MNTHNQNLMNEYIESKETFKKIQEFTMKRLKELLVDEEHLFLAGMESRIKEEKSLEKKLELKGMKYKTLSDITDIFGARIITFYNDEIDLVASIIEKNFNIDFTNSIDKRKLYDVDRFGYMSLHYICSIPKSLYSDPAYPKLNDYKFEIQIRTALQHVWATIFHDTGYKTDVEVPKEYIRNLSRLAGMLEFADDEFRKIRDNIDEYRNKIKKLVSKGDFKDITLNIDSYKNYLELNPFDDLIKKIAKINNSEIEYSSLEPYYEILVDMNIKTLSELEKLRVDYSEDAYKLSLLQLKGTDLDIISNTVALQNLCIIYIVKKGRGEPELLNLYNHLYGEKPFHTTIVKKILEQAKGIASL